VDAFGRYQHFTFEIDGRMSGLIRQVPHQLLVATLTKLLMASVLPQTFVSIVSSCTCIQLVIGSTSKMYLAQLALGNEKHFIKLYVNE
jgi:hypothetical protein